MFFLWQVEDSSSNGNIEVEVHPQKKDLSAWEETLLQALSVMENQENSPVSEQGSDKGKQSQQEESKTPGMISISCICIMCWIYTN